MPSIREASRHSQPKRPQSAWNLVLDDGWFGKRNDAHAGHGDWVVNPAKFPNDLQPLIAEVNRLGMDFGLWVEPEMVNPNSDLYRAHILTGS